METLCDNKSVGVIIRNPEGAMLLLDRARYPFGLAPPAGHVDAHGSLEQAAITETYEEVGLHLPLTSLRKVIDARRVDNCCRRQGGDHHIWTIFLADNIEGAIKPSAEETLGSAWRTPAELQELIENTQKTIAVEAKIGEQVLEPIWLNFLTELGFIKIEK